MPSYEVSVQGMKLEVMKFQEVKFREVKFRNLKILERVKLLERVL